MTHQRAKETLTNKTNSADNKLQKQAKLNNILVTTYGILVTKNNDKGNNRS